MCEMCQADTENLGEITPGMHLVRARRQGDVMHEGEYGLVFANPPFALFDAMLLAPSITPDPVDTRRWWAAFKEFTDSLEGPPKQGWQTVLACIPAGYDPEGPLTEWLLNRARELVAQRAHHADQQVVPRHHDLD